MLIMVMQMSNIVGDMGDVGDAPSLVASPCPFANYKLEFLAAFSSRFLLRRPSDADWPL